MSNGKQISLNLLTWSFLELTCEISVNGTSDNETTVLVGATVVFHCSCNDTIWKLNGDDIDEEFNSRYIIDNANNNTLTVESVRTSDIGSYTCGDNNFTLSLEGKIIWNEISLIYPF